MLDRLFAVFLHFINIPWWEDDESEELDDEPNDPDAEPDTAEDEADAEDWRLLWFSCCMAAGFSSAIQNLMLINKIFRRSYYDFHGRC